MARTGSAQRSLLHLPTQRWSSRRRPSSANIRCAAAEQLDDSLKAGAPAIRDYSSEEARARFAKSLFLGSAFQQRLRIGKVNVTILEAAHLASGGTSASADSSFFIVVSVESKSWRSQNKGRELYSRVDEHAEFFVNRFDAIVRITVFSSDVKADTLIAKLDIPVQDLAGLGTVKRWWLLGVIGRSVPRSASLHLRIAYDVSAFGEAMSIMWATPRVKSALESFDVNTLYNNAKMVKRELKPYADFIIAADNAIRWVDCAKSRQWLACMLLVAFFVTYTFTILHYVFAAILVRNLYVKQRLLSINRTAVEIFRSIDTDKSGTLDLNEIRTAIIKLSERIKVSRLLTDLEIEKMFCKYEDKKLGGLTLENFTELLMSCPSIVGAYAAAWRNDEEDAQQVEIDYLDRFSTEEYDAAWPESVNENSQSKRDSPNGTHSMSLDEAAPSIVQRSADEDAAGIKKPSGPLHGVAKKVINHAARRFAGDDLARFSRELGRLAKHLEIVRAIVVWESNPILSIIAVVANLLLASCHRTWPSWALAVTFVAGLFFIFSEKKMALDQIVCRCTLAFRRYMDLKRGVNLKKNLLEPGSRPFTPHSHKVNVNSAALQSVISGIFSRLDADGSGKLSCDEFCDFLKKCMPDATTKSFCECEDFVRTWLANADANGDNELDFDEFKDIITQAGWTRLLIRDELMWQLQGSGVSCIKLPSRKSFGVARLRSYPTRLTFKEKQLCRTNRRGAEVIVRSDTLIDIASLPGSEQSLTIRFQRGGTLKELALNIGPALRDPLLELLSERLLGRRNEDNGFRSNIQL